MDKVFVTAVAVMSLDGYISDNMGRQPNQVKYGGWTSKEDKSVFKNLFSNAGAVIIGSSTFLQSPKIFAKLSRKKHGVPLAVVHRAIKEERTEEIREALVEADGRSMLIDPGSFVRTLDAVVSVAGAMETSDLLVVGGSRTYGWLRNVVNEWSIVTEPVFLGAGKRLFPSDDGFVPPHFLVRADDPRTLNDVGTSLESWWTAKKDNNYGRS
jgi:dihydrofolate reductase